MTWGIKVSKPGFDVKTATADQLVMSSEYSSLKVAHTDSPTTSGTYAHGLSYIPAFFAISYYSSTESLFLGQDTQSIFEFNTYYCDSTNFHFGVPCRYVLFYQDTL